MKNIIIALIAAASLAACGTTGKFVDTKVVTKTEYIVRVATDAQKTIPSYTPTINPDTASQSDLAEWITASEERQWRLEVLIQELIKFYERPVSAAEQTPTK